MESPPFFKRGPSPLARLTIFVCLSLAMLVADAHYGYLNLLRQSLALAIYPLQRIANSPRDLAEQVGSFFVTQTLLQSENSQLKQQQLLDAAKLQRFRALQSENDHLRQLLNAQKRFGERVVLAEILHGGRNPFVRGIVVNKGSVQHIRPGSPVVDEIGLIGQVTRVYPLSSQVTLVTDKSQSVPVEIVRNGLRAIVMGSGQDGTLDLPFMPVNADVQNGDVLVTSGIDGTYPPGLPVGVVTRIERNTAYAFAKITCAPSAGVGRHRQVLILSGTPEPQAAPQPQAPPAAHHAKHRSAKIHRKGN